MRRSILAIWIEAMVMGMVSLTLFYVQSLSAWNILPKPNSQKDMYSPLLLGPTATQDLQLLVKSWEGWLNHSSMQCHGPHPNPYPSSTCFLRLKFTWGNLIVVLPQKCLYLAGLFPIARRSFCNLIPLYAPSSERFQDKSFPGLVSSGGEHCILLLF